MGKAVLVIPLVAAVAFGMAAFVHPEGFDGALAMIGLDEHQPVSSDDIGDGAVDAIRKNPTQAARDALTKADAAYDVGDFATALPTYTVAASLTPDPHTKLRAQQSGRKTTLALALIDGALPPAGEESTRQKRFFDLRARAQSTNDESDWLTAMRFAAVAGYQADLALLAKGTLDAAVSGGPVEAALNAAAKRSGGAAERAINEAITMHGLLVVGRSTGGGSGMTNGMTHPDDTDDEPSGIGGTGKSNMPDVAPAFTIRGDFSNATRKSLEEAVEEERNGLHHFQLSGADASSGVERKNHRREAFKSLTKARNIYAEAAEEDPKSKSLEKRLARLYRAIALLRKEMTPDEMR